MSTWVTEICGPSVSNSVHIKQVHVGMEYMRLNKIVPNRVDFSSVKTKHKLIKLQVRPLSQSQNHSKTKTKVIA